MRSLALKLSTTVGDVPASWAILVTIFVVAGAGIVFYARYKKGDVRAMFSLYPFSFILEAKDRQNKPGDGKEARGASS